MAISIPIIWHAAPRDAATTAAAHLASRTGASVMLSDPPATLGHRWIVNPRALAFARALQAAGVNTSITVWVSPQPAWREGLINWLKTSAEARGWDSPILLNVEGEWNRSSLASVALGEEIGAAAPRGTGVVTFGPAGTSARSSNEPDDGIIAMLRRTGGPLVVEAYSRQESGFNRPEWSPSKFGAWMAAKWRERGYTGPIWHGIGVYGTPHQGWDDQTRITDAAKAAPPRTPLYVWAWGSTDARELATLAALPRSTPIPWTMIVPLLALAGGAALLWR